MEKELRTNQTLWNEWTDINSRSDMYNLKAFKEGANKLDTYIRGEVGDVTGKKLLHMQCHFGMDTLSWARLGAEVTGVDFSPRAIEVAESLSRELNIPARFICCNIYDLPANLEGQFDIVFASYGVINWLPDFPRWMEIAARYIKPGGFFYLAEGHPLTWVFDEYSDNWAMKYPYFQKEVLKCDVQGSYADTSAKVNTPACFQWQHTMGEIVTEVCRNGLRLEFLHESGKGFFPTMPDMKEGDDGFWHHPKGDDTLPIVFSLKAWK